MTTNINLGKKITIADLSAMNKRDEKITMLTAYDATFARLVDSSNIEMILVGDSLGMVVQGFDTTLPVTVDDIIYHTKCVARATRHAHIVADMPFMSYQASVDDAIANTGRVIKEGGAESVKLEGGLEIIEKVRAITSSGIPVMAHIGLKPQSIHQMGGYKIQGKTSSSGKRLLEEAAAFEDVGAYSLLLEGIAIETAREITAKVSIPTIGIASGPFCSGQVLVIYDLLGMNEEFTPKFLKKYRNLSKEIKDAVNEFSNEVKDGAFPSEEHSFKRLLEIAKEEVAS